jgi:membrane protein YqaA with SNARE-associated domain
MSYLQRSLKALQKFSDRPWYLPLVAVLAALDNIIVIVPTDGIAISNSLLHPRRWFWSALFISGGSTLGAMVLAILVEKHGLPWALHMYPGIDQTEGWKWAAEFSDKWGLALVVFVAMTPLPQQPTIILSAVAFTPVWEITAAVGLGRTAKYLLMSYLASHAPRVLEHVWGWRAEMREIELQQIQAPPDSK